MVKRGKIQEPTLYHPLANYLESLGYKTVINPSVSGREPDFVVDFDSFRGILEIKIGGEEKLLDGVSQSYEYMNSTGIRNLIVLVYPEETRQQIISTTNLNLVAVDSEVRAWVLTEYWNTRTSIKPKELFERLKVRVEEQEKVTDLDLVVDTIREGILEISQVLRSFSGVSIKNAIDLVVGRFDLFLALGELSTKSAKEEQRLKLAALDLISYILVNQILFYHTYSVITRKVSPLNEEIDSIVELEKQFNKIEEINYKAIYSIKVASKLPQSQELLDTAKKIIKSIKVVKPEHVRHDLLGRLFHELLPSKTRKLLAAFYTKPVAAELLATLAIDSWDDKVMDIACGSGTLLVSSYGRKLNLSGEGRDLEELHKRFVEEDITGIDIMPFAAHLTAINLSSQNISATTNSLRVAAKDSLRLAPKITVEQFSREIQTKLTKFSFPNSANHNIDSDTIVSVEGSVSPEGVGEEFKLSTVDVVIMNPPFTRKEIFPEEIRNFLSENWSKYRTMSYWGYFILLADRFLKKNRKIAAVLPASFFRGIDSEDLREFLFGKDGYSLCYVVKTTKEPAFTESARFRDFLIVLEKKKPKTDDVFAMVYLLRSINEITLEDARRLGKKIRAVSKGENYTDNEIAIQWIKHEEVIENLKNLWLLVGFSSPQAQETVTKFYEAVLDRSKKFVELKELVNVVDSKDSVLRGLEASPPGLFKVAFLARETHPSRVERSSLIFSEETDTCVTATLKKVGALFKIPKKVLWPALRTPSYLDKLCIDEQKDYIIKKLFPDFAQISEKVGVNGVEFSYIQDKGKDRFVNLVVARRMNLASEGTRLLAFYSDTKILPSKNFYCIKIDKEIAKPLSLWLNSTFSLANLLLIRRETEGSWSEIAEEDLLKFMVPMLKEDNIRLLNETFERLRDVHFPPLLEQYKSKFVGRQMIDNIILKMFGFKEGEAEKMLNTLYSAVFEELTALRKAMGS